MNPQLDMSSSGDSIPKLSKPIDKSYVNISTPTACFVSTLLSSAGWPEIPFAFCNERETTKSPHPINATRTNSQIGK